jgi:hypothetical protein
MVRKFVENSLIFQRTQYGLHQDAVALCKTGGDEAKWKKAVFWVFDSPDLLSTPFEVIIGNETIVTIILGENGEIKRVENSRSIARLCKDYRTCQM